MNRDFKGVWVPREIYLAPDLSWSEKFLLIEIDSLDSDPEKGCFASARYLADFLGMKEGSVKNMISTLRQKGYLVELWSDGHSRGLRSTMTISNRHKKVTVNRHKKMTQPSQKNDAEPSQKNDYSNKEKKSLVIQERRSAAKPAAPRQTNGNGDFIADLKTNPAYAHIDIDRELAKANTWCDTNRRQNTQRFFVNWLNRIDPPLNGNGHRNTAVGRLIEPLDAEPEFIPPDKPLRPAVNVPPEQQRVWQAVLDALKKKLNADVYNTWFKPLIFDGFNAENNAFEVRTGQITKDWVCMYYTELITELLPDLGLGEFTIHWTVDTGEYKEVVIA